MIIFRYLNREIVLHTLAVTSVLLLIVMSGRFVRYLADAASGKLAVDVLLAIMAYRIPGFLELVLPLSFFIAVLLSYGRLYVDSEMVVLSACGMSQAQLLAHTLASTLLMAVVVGGLSLWVSPLGAQQTELLLAEQRQRSEFDMLKPGRFQEIGSGQLMTYVEDLSADRQRLNDVFIAQVAEEAEPRRERLSLVVAEYAEQTHHSEYNQRYLQLHNGYRYDGRPGSRDFEVTAFQRYGHHLPEPDVAAGYQHRADTLTTVELMDSDHPHHQVALQWRLSLPLLVLIVGLLAVPLSRTSPRQGRYLKMLPAVVVFMTYLGFLSTARGMAEAGNWPLWPGLWVIHLPYLLLALILLGVPGRLWEAVRGGRRG